MGLVKFSMSGVPLDRFQVGQPIDPEGIRRGGDPSFVAMLLRMRILIGCAGQSGPAAPDSKREYMAVGLKCQENNIINRSRFERIEMSLVLLRIEVVEIFRRDASGKAYQAGMRHRFA